VIVVRVKVNRGFEPLSPMGIDSADTSQPPNVQICIDKSQLLQITQPGSSTNRSGRYTKLVLDI
jgi:hypothetical protein